MAAGRGGNMAWVSRKTYEHLEDMLDAAIAEEFEESAYDEKMLSRLESGTIQVLPQRQSLLPLLLAVEKRGEEKQKKRKIRFETQGWETSGLAWFDRKWTEEAVYNVLDNALKYTEEASTVRMRVRRYEFFVCLEIEDEGPGVDLDEVPRLFDRFYRSPQMQDREGVGLGLFLTREILKKQKGYIKVKNGVKGACFQIYLQV